ncbi:16998_t:CDS:2 [Funneliformis caledonium]|uniref:16998_t:CDS:1 n=1 Tax=Funneliformis caledonium TaxID=1117310 RepID=A0A9N9F5N3_9GLOM|nr:16998_t:CDS:2 [Funneliformis caledonium]
MNNFEKGKELEDKTADRLDAVGVKNNKNWGIESSSWPWFQPGPGDGGIDISGEAASHKFAIQCKNWANIVSKVHVLSKNETQLIDLETQLGRNIVNELARVLSKRENCGNIGINDKWLPGFEYLYDFEYRIGEHKGDLIFADNNDSRSG